MRPDHRRQPVAERGWVGDRAGADDKAVEIVVVVLTLDLVDRGARGEVVFRRGGDAERDGRRDPPLLDANQLHPRPQPRLDLGAQRREFVARDQIGLVQDHQIGAGQLVGKHLFEWVVVRDRRIRRPLPRDRVRVVGEAALGRRGGVDNRDHAIDRRASADLRPGEGLHQRLRQGETRGLDHDMAGRLGAVDQPRQGRQEIVGDGAAQAAIRQFDDVVLGAGRVAAAEQEFAVDAKLAELVDDDREPVAGGVGQQVPHQAGLAGAEKAGNDRRRNTPHRSGSLQHERQSRRDKDDAVGEPGDLLVQPARRVAKPAAQRRLRHQPHADFVGDQHHRPRSVAQGRMQCRDLRLNRPFRQHHIRQPQGQAIDQQGPLGRRLGRDRRGERERRLDGAPERTPARPMRGDARRHLGVSRLGGGAIGAVRRGRLDEAFGMAALAGARAAQHQGYRRKRHAVRHRR